MKAKTLRQLLALIVIILLFFIFFFLLRVILPFFLAFFLAFLIEPVVGWFEKKGAGRTAAVITVFFILAVFGTVVVVWLLPGLIEDLNKALTKLPVYIRQIQEWFVRFNREYERFRLPQNIRQVIDEALLRGEESLRQFLLRAGSLIISVFPQSLLLLLTPILAFYFSRDLKKFKAWARYWAAEFFHEDQSIVLEITRVITAYLRAQALASLEVGILLTIGLLLLRIDLAILIGLLAGIFNIIPYFGPILGAAPAVFLAAQDSPWKAVYVIILFFLVNQLETAVILPKLIGERVGLHPIAVIFLLLVGGEFFGFLGMVFAVPAGAVLQVIFKYYWKKTIGSGGYD